MSTDEHSTVIDWQDLFGDSEEDSADNNDVLNLAQKPFYSNQHVQPIVTFDAIPGLRLVRNALSHDEQMALVHALLDNGFFSNGSNQAMLFGQLPNYLNWLEPWVLDKYPKLYDEDILNKKKPLFDQAILNLYTKGEGIASHVDLLRFEDGILIVSLLSSCVMTMRPARKTSNGTSSTNYTKYEDNPSVVRHDILLQPGDVLALSKEARYQWEHGIDERAFDEIDGDRIERGTRISVTLRKLKDGEELSPLASNYRR